ncbi:MAG: hypothetical protein Q9165_004973 [Trypethelium subeluteriae]
MPSVCNEIDANIEDNGSQNNLSENDSRSGFPINYCPTNDGVNGDNKNQFEYSSTSHQSDHHNGKTEPIAIIGMACRLPGQSSSTLKLRNMLRNGASGHGPIPLSRFNAAGFYHPDPNIPGSINADTGYFIQEDLHAFENSFFGINNLEAQYMDPQQRKLLEVVYECLENAGLSLEEVSGSCIGCYIGNWAFDFALIEAKDPESYTRYHATGAGPTLLANRISHVFDFKGPSVVQDTACSSSLYALHAACSALRNGDCTAAVVAGANLIQTPEHHMSAVKAGVISNDGTCHSFDSSANGYGRAEGVVALYLKPLQKALSDGDRIRSVICGTATNSNGRTSGSTLPSADGQEAVIRKAYENAGLSPSATDYVEAHGTGTPVGDPIETEALSRVFHHHTGRPTFIGSIKTNLGHSEACSGISGIIKATLALEDRAIPPTIGLTDLNPKIESGQRNLEVVTSLCPWPVSKRPRASVSSFGVGGANAHAILESADCHVPAGYSTPIQSYEGQASAEKPFILPFAARTEYSLRKIVGQLSEYLSAAVPSIEVTQIARNLIARATHKTRGYIIMTETQNVKHLDIEDMEVLESEEVGDLPIAFVFTGQGAQWPQMGFELIRHFPSFRNTINRLDSTLAHLTDHPPTWSLRDVLAAPSVLSDINTAICAQTACTALQIALVDLLSDWNILADTVVGHSSGEIAAAYAAGFIDAQQAIAAAYYRGLAVSQIKEEGTMVSVGIGVDQAHEDINSLRLGSSVQVACVNSPESVTLSGDDDGIKALIELFHIRGVYYRRLKTDGRAYHSHHVRAIGEYYEGLLTKAWKQFDVSVPSNRKQVRMISSVTGTMLQQKIAQAPDYWRRNLESRVLFFQTVHSLLTQTNTHLIELGPHPALKLPIRQIWDSMSKQKPENLLYTCSLQRGQNAAYSILKLVGRLYLHHYRVNLTRSNGLDESDTDSSNQRSQRRFLTDFPGYPWAYEETLWNESRLSLEFRTREYPRHELIGSRIPGGSGLNLVWRNVLSVTQLTWLQDHCLSLVPVFPAAAYLAIAIEALCQALNVNASSCPSIEISSFSILNALALPSDGSKVEMFTELEACKLSHSTSSKQSWNITISSHTNGSATVHVKGLVKALSADHKIQRNVLFSTENLEKQANRIWYDKFQKEGLIWGPSFARLNNIRVEKSGRASVAVAETIPNRGEWQPWNKRYPYLIHPTSIDCMLQTALIATASGMVRNVKARVPVSIGRAVFSGSSALDVNDLGPWSIRASSRAVGFGTRSIATELYQDFNTLVQLEDVRVSLYDGKAQENFSLAGGPLVRVVWKPDICLFDHGVNQKFGKYLEWYSRSRSLTSDGSDRDRIMGALDLIAHKKPGLRICHLGNNIAATLSCLEVLCHTSPLRRFRSFTSVLMNEGEEFLGRDWMQKSVDAPFAIDERRLDTADVFDLFISFEAGS